MSNACLLRDRYLLRDCSSGTRKIPPEQLSVYQEISKLNGFVDRMGLPTIKQTCKELGIDSHGVKHEHHKKEKLSEAGLFVDRNVDFFEPLLYKHEIIEFPAVLVSSRTATVVDTFHEYIRPLINTRLSTFCTNLTGISQSTVDGSETFLNVHDKFLDWMEFHGLGSKYTFSLVTDGPFDMGRFLYLQTQHSSLQYPAYALNWVNLRKCFSNFYKPTYHHHQGHQHEKTSTPGLQVMLGSLGLEFQGSPHSGIDDAKNIARIVIRLLRDQAFIRINEKIVLDGGHSQRHSPPNPGRLQT
ncbi:3'5' exoribonuclease 1like, partial [Caligus rogercresseyi]